jgi:ABC-type nitrate/sulfonate/bicarbonate transport system substrate-binding protein
MPGRWRLRTALVIGAVLLSAACNGTSSHTLTLRIAFVPNSSLGGIIARQMRDNRLIEKDAHELGTEVNIEWSEYPTAPAMVQAMIAGSLDVAISGFIPLSNAIAQKQDIHMLSIYEGKVDFWLAVRPGSGIHTVEDLRGKTVGTFVGGDVNFFLTQLLRAHTGKSDPSQLGINVVNLPSAAVMENMPAGVDAVTIFPPNYLDGLRKGALVGLVSLQGETGPAWIGGAGTQPSQFKNSPAYPEGYLFQRAAWIARGETIRSSPNVIEALLIAQQQALQQLRQLDSTQVAAKAAQVWGIPPELGKQIVESDLLWSRPWTWWTEGDFNGLAQADDLAVQAKLMRQSLSVDQLVANYALVAPIAKRAYERINYPDPAAFTDPSAKDLRGPPAWDLVH